MCVCVQVRGLQAQLADAKQAVQDQTSQATALQARLDAANDNAAKQQQEHSKLQVLHLVKISSVHGSITPMAGPEALFEQFLGDSLATAKWVLND